MATGGRVSSRLYNVAEGFAAGSNPEFITFPG
jgi:hypothetical protein